jgi:tRNA(fMet)-specific endonuclease VapC
MPTIGNRFVVDTSAVIAFRRGTTAAREAFLSAELLYLPTIALGELYYGAHNATNSERSIGELKELLPAFAIVPVDGTTARCYGEIKSRLRKAGTPIPENDIWIAAIANQMSLPLLARDDHFKAISEVHNLQV